MCVLSVFFFEFAGNKDVLTRNIFEIVVVALNFYYENVINEMLYAFFFFAKLESCTVVLTLIS